MSIIVFTVVIGVGLASWFAVLIYGIKAVLGRKPGVKLWSRETGWNPANVLILPHLLTDEGLVYRRKCFLSAIVFLLAVGTGLGISAVAGNL